MIGADPLPVVLVLDIKIIDVFRIKAMARRPTTSKYRERTLSHQGIKYRIAFRADRNSDQHRLVASEIVICLHPRQDRVVINAKYQVDLGMQAQGVQSHMIGAVITSLSVNG